MNSSSSIINKVILDGYTECFRAFKEGLYTPSKKKYYTPEQVNIVDFYRFEGLSDPADNSILYIIETIDGVKGTLLDAYGAECSVEVCDFVNLIPEICKK